jgi:GTPase SAR1 family protein
LANQVIKLAPCSQLLGVGKTSFWQMHYSKEFNEGYRTCTIGIEFCVKQVEFDNQTLKVQMWDTAGTIQ